ncbi:MAG: exopolysaccharide biosynthesis polyprenyl glycosylphosphotransferase [Clostridia bacterium]|nr:exopolysaccharide biosynthesis polyprenyl glycosylphosphotransferase [Clostridia bacterium]
MRRKKRELFKRSLRMLFSLFLIAAQTVCFGYVWLNYYLQGMSDPFFEKGNWLFYAVYALLFIVFLFCFDGMKYGLYRRPNIILSQILATLGTAFVTYLQICLLSLKFVNVLPILAMTGVNIVICVVFTMFSDWVIRVFFPARKMLVIWDNYSPEQFLRKMGGRKDKYTPEEIVHVSVGMEKLEQLIQESESVLVYDVHSEMRNKLIKYCFEQDIRAYSTTKVSDILIRGAEQLHVFDTPLLLYRNIGLTMEQRFFKRLMDIVISSIMLIIASPFLLISALAVKLYDGGPVFFLQDRCTIGGKVFKIHKFRSMVVDAEKYGAQLATEKDPRITPVGRILRATRLDELPQLIDILVGNMSLVGPRPERPEITEQYCKEIPEFKYRLKVQGGLTGYAQLYGKYNTSAYDKLQLDLMYVQNYSLLLDLRLILLTLKIMFMRESTEGVSEQTNQKIAEMAERSAKEAQQRASESENGEE